VSEETDNPADSHPGCLSLLQPEHIERLARVKPYMPRNARFGNIAMKAIEEQNVVQIAKAFSDSVRFSIYRHLSELNEMRLSSDVRVANNPSFPARTFLYLRVKSDEFKFVDKR
jgi:hypothetical protein